MHMTDCGSSQIKHDTDRVIQRHILCALYGFVYAWMLLSVSLEHFFLYINWAAGTNGLIWIKRRDRNMQIECPPLAEINVCMFGTQTHAHSGVLWPLCRHTWILPIAAERWCWFLIRFNCERRVAICLHVRRSQFRWFPHLNPGWLCINAQLAWRFSVLYVKQSTFTLKQVELESMSTEALEKFNLKQPIWHLIT